MVTAGARETAAADLDRYRRPKMIHRPSGISFGNGGCVTFVAVAMWENLMIKEI